MSVAEKVKTTKDEAVTSGEKPEPPGVSLPQPIKAKKSAASQDSADIVEPRTPEPSVDMSSPPPRSDEDLPDPEAADIKEIEALIGTQLDGRYRIDKELARGGMGVVFRAQHLSLNRDVVIKVLRASQTESSSAKARFEREARRACQLDHPNIVTVHDFGYHDELGYLVMEHVDGITLYDYVRKYGPLTFAQFAPVANAILSGLAEAHRQSIVHRDIKASNIMLTFDDQNLRRVKILDFGLAKAEGAAEDDVTRQSALVGTMGAMPPERILCQDTDCRVDLYALGICCYRLIAGRRPFVGEDMHVLYQHVHEHPPPLTDMLPAGHEYPIMVLEWVHRLLAKDPNDRPRDASHARDWLLETVSDKAVFRLDEGDVAWKERIGEAQFGTMSGTYEYTDPSWTATSAPSGSYRSLLSASSAARAVAEMRAESSAGTDPVEPEVEPTPPPVATGPPKAAIAVAAVLVLLLVAVLGVALTRDDGAATPSTGQPTVESPEQPAVVPVAAGSAEKLDAVFEQIQHHLEKGAYATAENLLESVRPQLTQAPTETQVRAAEFQAKIDIDKHLRKAKQSEEELSIEEAIAHYDDVLSLDAGNSEAQERLDDLNSKVVLKVSSLPINAGVYVDDERIGSTPFEGLLDMNFSKVEVRMKKHHTWSESFVPKGGTSLVVVANLDKRGGRRGQTPTTPDKKDGIDNEELMGMGQ